MLKLCWCMYASLSISAPTQSPPSYPGDLFLYFRTSSSVNVAFTSAKSFKFASLTNSTYCGADTCSKNWVADWKVRLELYEMLGVPFSPRFVVTKTTPFPALAPYTAADASFNILMLAMSFWSILEKSIWTPSTNIRGASLKLLILIWVFSPPGNPEFCLLITPGTLPDNKFDVFGTGIRVNSSFLIVETEPVTFIFSWEPYPTTTTSFNVSISGEREISNKERPLIDISFLSYPEKDATKTVSLYVVIENNPSKSVTAPLVVPLTIIVAPGRGSPFSSTILPFTLWFWEKIKWAWNKNKKNKNFFLNSII